MTGPLQAHEHFPAHWDPAWIERRWHTEVRRLGYVGPGAPARTIPLPPAYRMVRLALVAARLYARGHRNFLDVRLSRQKHRLKNWPRALDGFRILQVSDLHIDLDPGLLQPLCRRLQGVACELIAFTGDFCEGSRSSPEFALAQLDELLDAAPPAAFGRYGVLGNHDAMAVAAALEQRGIRLLVNEAVVLGAGAASFALAGIDDPYLFGLHDISRAARQCPPGTARVLLSHSPQVAAEAAAAGFDLMLSGHTHGGQICLPGGYSLVNMPAIPGRLFRGPWHSGPLAGYTTTGTGSCHIPVRFNCPPEIVLHTLQAH